MMDGEEPDVVLPTIIANARRFHQLIDISLGGVDGGVSGGESD